MTARARITQAELIQAATIAKAEGVSVTITAPNGKTYTIAPALDVKGESEQAHDRSMGYGRCVNRKARVLPLAERSRNTLKRRLRAEARADAYFRRILAQ